MSATPQIAVGIMSGTSLDAVDVVACRFHADSSRQHRDAVTLELLASHTAPIPAALRDTLRNATDSQPDSAQRHWSLANFASLEAQLGELYASATLELLQAAQIAPQQVLAIGCHGQTVMHLPPPHPLAATLQLNDPARLAARTGIPVVADFRRADIALGGQGAPLVPAFHRALFATPEPRAICNIGGIANLTLLHSDHCAGFDCGPGNALLDGWCLRHTGKPYDENGGWASSGKVAEPLLQELMAHPYLAQQPPKSCGREQFNKSLLAHCDANPVDVQATLTEFTALTICSTLASYAECQQVIFEELLVCGGGAKNEFLMSRIAAHSSQPVGATATAGLAPEWVEAAAFAWLARQRLLELPGNVTAVTGAAREAILGGLYLP